MTEKFAFRRAVFVRSLLHGRADRTNITIKDDDRVRIGISTPSVRGEWPASSRLLSFRHRDSARARPIERVRATVLSARTVTSKHVCLRSPWAYETIFTTNDITRTIYITSSSSSSRNSVLYAKIDITERRTYTRRAGVKNYVCLFFTSTDGGHERERNRKS